MKKLLFFSCFNLILIYCSGQSTATVILDEDYNSLPYCVAVCNNEYVYPDNDSEFDLSPYDSCVITNLGYQSLNWRKSDNDNDTLVMKKLEIMMDEVVIRPQLLMEEKRLGPAGRGLLSGLNYIRVPPMDGSAVIYLPIKSEKGIITSLWSGIKEVQPGIEFKLCLFSWNQKNEMSNKNLLHCAIVDDEEILKEIDVSKENIEIPNNGVFLSLTWESPKELEWPKNGDYNAIFNLPVYDKKRYLKYTSTYYYHHNNTVLGANPLNSPGEVQIGAIGLGVKYREYQE